jgi:hypothetical protein
MEPPKDKLTDDGYDVQFGVNVIGNSPFSSELSFKFTRLL